MPSMPGALGRLQVSRVPPRGWEWEWSHKNEAPFSCQCAGTGESSLVLLVCHTCAGLGEGWWGGWTERKPDQSVMSEEWEHYDVTSAVKTLLNGAVNGFVCYIVGSCINTCTYPLHAHFFRSQIYDPNSQVLQDEVWGLTASQTFITCVVVVIRLNRLDGFWKCKRNVSVLGRFIAKGSLLRLLWMHSFDGVTCCLTCLLLPLQCFNMGCFECN